MPMTKFITVVVLSTLMVSCIKTADQLNREKKFDSMSEQLTDSQSLMSELVNQVKEMKSQLAQLNGKVEELEHNQKNVDPNSLTKLTEDLNLLKSQKELETTQINEIQAQLKEQKEFLEKVTNSLVEIEKNKSKNTNSNKSSSFKKKSAKQELTELLTIIKKKPFAEAKNTLLTLLEKNELSPGDTNKALHALGQLEFEKKNFDQALVYFSKIYTKYPKATLAPSSLFFIGKSLKQMGKKEEAKQAFAKLSEDYPRAKETSEAKKEL